MKLIDSILISLSLVFFVIGVNEVINSQAEELTGAVVENYWIFMISLCCILGLRLVRQRRKQKEAEENPNGQDQNGKDKKQSSASHNKPKKKKRKKR